MSLFSVFDISSAGMSVEQTKLAVAAANLANSRTTQTADGSPYQPMTAVLRSTPYHRSDFASIEQAVDAAALPRPAVVDIVPTNAAPRLVYDPGHPDADAKGFVAYPAVDGLSTMMDLMTISRSYEANLRAFDITRSLIQRTIDMGRGR
ncbi:MAG: flagellar basal body rod protein FlgC [Steroidobacteraceae bacterium]